MVYTYATGGRLARGCAVQDVGSSTSGWMVWLRTFLRSSQSALCSHISQNTLPLANNWWGASYCEISPLSSTRILSQLISDNVSNILRWWAIVITNELVSSLCWIFGAKCGTSTLAKKVQYIYAVVFPQGAPLQYIPTFGICVLRKQIKIWAYSTQEQPYVLWDYGLGISCSRDIHQFLETVSNSPLGHLTQQWRCQCHQDCQYQSKSKLKCSIDCNHHSQDSAIRCFQNP